MSDIYMFLNRGLDKTLAKAKKASKEENGDHGKDDYLYPSAALTNVELEFDKGTLKIDGSNDLGFYSLNIDLDLDIVVEIIEFYMKKLGKLKTVIEATK